MKAWGYTRRSREKEKGEYSLEDQDDRIRAWASYRQHDLEDVLREDNVSGSTPPDERPLLGPTLKQLQEGDILVVAKFDRLSRDLLDFAGLIKRSQREGWALVCLDPELDLTTASGRAMAGMLAVFAEYEKAQTIERLLGGKRAKAKAGGYVGGSRLHRRYGFVLVDDPDGSGGKEYVPVAAEQEVIARMKDLRESNTLRGVCEALEAAGVEGPTGNGWNEPTIHRILKRSA
jgi:site-specific DNA recombinase